MTSAPLILWFRRDLRLGDHPMLSAAVATGRPIIPVFIHDECVDALGAAPRFRLGLSLDDFGKRLGCIGSRLVLRRGAALASLEHLIAQTGATAVWWTRNYDPESKIRDTSVKSTLKAKGIDAKSFAGHLLFEPMDVATGQGGPYRVYSPFWKAVRDRTVANPLPAPSSLIAPKAWPDSDRLQDWQMAGPMRRGAAVVSGHAVVGEQAALRRLDDFIDSRIDGYKLRRDFPGISATSGLSENLTYGEISPRVLWHAGWSAMTRGAAGAEHFLKEVVWREFSYHLIHHTPHIVRDNWRPEWDNFPWSTDESHPHVLAWKQGRTGVEFVDAAMRELYVTGTMHNRARMIVASYLTKHLMTHWRIGLTWFQDCLIDWDPAANAMGWQWVAGSGPDAAPYFRVFNPDGQSEKFDADRSYRARWIAEGQAAPPDTALSFFDAAPLSWGLSPRDTYPQKIEPLDVGRARALAAYAARATQNPDDPS